jgi:hypothetical protein
VVARCSNPACNREFRDLRKGRLFLLPPTYVYSDSMKLSDYCYWLCPECDATHTIMRRESEVVVSEQGPGTPYLIPASSHRRKRPGQITLRGDTQVG